MLCPSPAPVVPPWHGGDGLGSSAGGTGPVLGCCVARPAQPSTRGAARWGSRVPHGSHRVCPCALCEDAQGQMRAEEPVFAWSMRLSLSHGGGKECWHSPEVPHELSPFTGHPRCKKCWAGMGQPGRGTGPGAHRGSSPGSREADTSPSCAICPFLFTLLQHPAFLKVPRDQDQQHSPLCPRCPSRGGSRSRAAWAPPGACGKQHGNPC